MIILAIFSVRISVKVKCSAEINDHVVFETFHHTVYRSSMVQGFIPRVDSLQYIKVFFRSSNSHFLVWKGVNSIRVIRIEGGLSQHRMVGCASPRRRKRIAVP